MDVQDAVSDVGRFIRYTIGVIQGIGIGFAVLASGVLIASSVLLYPYIHRFELASFQNSSAYPVARLDRVTGHVTFCSAEKAKEANYDSKNYRYVCSE